MKKKKSNKKAPTKVFKKTVSKSKPAVKKVAAPSSNKTGVTPLADKVLVKPIEQETTTAFGIIIPNTAKERPETGIVVAVGPGKRTEGGTVVPVDVSVGDKIMFSKYGFDEVKVAGVEYFLINESNILAILN